MERSESRRRFACTWAARNLSNRLAEGAGKPLPFCFAGRNKPADDGCRRQKGTIEMVGKSNTIEVVLFCENGNNATLLKKTDCAVLRANNIITVLFYKISSGELLFQTGTIVPFWMALLHGAEVWCFSKKERWRRLFPHGHLSEKTVQKSAGRMIFCLRFCSFVYFSCGSAGMGPCFSSKAATISRIK